MLAVDNLDDTTIERAHSYLARRARHDRRHPCSVTVLAVAVAAAMSSAALVTAPAANAASYSSFQEVTACISQNFGDIDSGMNLNFIGIPPRFVASIGLYKVINGQGRALVVARPVTHQPSAGASGPLRRAERWC
jgi:hypothetical protein